MLNTLYELVTPWALANRNQVLKNRILGKIANYIYPVYCNVTSFKSNNKEAYDDQRREEDTVIVSLTSFPARINKMNLCINSILLTFMIIFLAYINRGRPKEFKYELEE